MIITKRQPVSVGEMLILSRWPLPRQGTLAKAMGVNLIVDVDPAGWPYSGMISGHCRGPG